MSTSTQSFPASVSTKSARGWAAPGSTSALGPFSLHRREPLPTDVAIDILYCGVCHSDLHMARTNGTCPSIPSCRGTRSVGRVARVGSEVTKFREGDLAAVGCMVDSCGTCPSCQRGLEQYCVNGATLTYNSADKHLGGMTYGGYSDHIVVDEGFVLKLSEKLSPLRLLRCLCAGITTYSPLHHWKAGPGKKVGIVGLAAWAIWA